MFKKCIDIRNKWNDVNSINFCKTTSNETSDTEKVNDVFENELKEEISNFGSEFYDNLKSI